MASYQQSPPDEGYSEDPLTVGTVSGPTTNAMNLTPWLQSLPVSERTDYVMGIMSALPTSEVCEIVRRLRPRLYIDFFQYLPPEVCLKILGFLDPVSLINTARASREWMLLALDRKLWEQLYILEGFRVVRSEVQKFEESLNRDRPRSSEHTDDEQPNKRRATPQGILPTLGDIDSEMTDAHVPMIRQESLFGPSKDTKVDVDEKMSDLPSLPAFQSPKPMQHSRLPRSTLHDRTNRRLSAASVLPKNSHPLSNISSLVVLDRGYNKKKMNWQYLYSQRRRLEANWVAERYTNFQLPHPNHPEEAHTECIYTIQYSGKWLVSGSRDRTLRIWDLDTRRLVRAPLEAHAGSVLCLQFDADPEEDLIVSGSSDATVVLWRFSTGEVIQRLKKAHRESVLNVRFDKHVLVTCSKDKTIKIFNRRPLSPGDLGYPGLGDSVHLPSGVNPVPMYLNNYGYNPSPTVGLSTKSLLTKTLPSYTMIGCLEGHGAAVNAVQIHGNEVVSASGDRTVKIWNWPAQVCTRTLVGHMKGIACVQYDGRRVVSGSSDNEVKIFDKESGLEISALKAHTSLVRTVQAGFGDLPYSEEQDEEDARATDLEYFKAVDSGTVKWTDIVQKGRPRNAGSKKPQHITAYGAKLPPGGGGGKFARIVSGSYDETIIIWRRDKEGVWKAQHVLKQEEAANVASRIAQRRVGSAAAATQPTQPTATQSAPTTLQPTSTASNLPPDVNAPTTPFAPHSTQHYHHIINISISHGRAALRHALQSYPQILGEPHLRQTIEALPEPTRSEMATEVVNATQLQQQQAASAQPGPSSLSQSPPASIQTQASASTSTTNQATQGPAPIQTALVAPTQSLGQLAVASPQVGQQLPAVTVAPATAPVPHPAPAHVNHHPTANMARVFKLQFDARRIICCSQASVIVGWDFANGDEQIIEASRFFAPIE